MWNALCYCGMTCCILLCVELALVLCKFVIYFLRVGHALVLRNFVLYLSAYGTCSGILEFCVKFFSVWNKVWYCGMKCYIALHAG